MTIIDNLIKGQFIKPGTWIGVDTNNRQVLYRYVVDDISVSGEITATDVRTMSRLRIRHDIITEVDGMRLDRFLQQADLDETGCKITGIKRRGRKPRARL